MSTKMPTRKIPQRDEIEVFVNRSCFITIKQVSYGQEEAIVVVHPDDVPQLIEFLKSAQEEAAECVPEE